MRPERRCRKCQIVLLTELELDFGICEGCADAAYYRDEKRREWDHYHPGESCPDGEIE